MTIRYYIEFIKWNLSNCVKLIRFLAISWKKIKLLKYIHKWYDHIMKKFILIYMIKDKYIYDMFVKNNLNFIYLLNTIQEKTKPLYKYIKLQCNFISQDLCNYYLHLPWSNSLMFCKYFPHIINFCYSTINWQYVLLCFL